MGRASLVKRGQKRSIPPRRNLNKDKPRTYVLAGHQNDLQMH